MILGLVDPWLLMPDNLCVRSVSVVKTKWCVCIIERSKQEIQHKFYICPFQPNLLGFLLSVFYCTARTNLQLCIQLRNSQAYCPVLPFSSSGSYYPYSTVRPAQIYSFRAFKNRCHWMSILSIEFSSRGLLLR